MKKNYYAILMAGGVGSRFWPVSTTKFPKQFHDMLGTGESLIQHTFKRLAKSIPEENIFILTNACYSDLVQEHLPQIRKDQIIGEPAMRNTAPCILYASLKIQKMDPNAVMIVAPSDHWIEDEKAFANDVQQSFETCEQNDRLITLGIKPTFPNTGYGYIEHNESENAIKKVSKFTEKPTYEKAKQFLAQGNYLWNAGIFIWSVSSILTAFENYQKEMMDLFVSGLQDFNTKKEEAFIINNYPLAENISIDYAILEQADNVYVVPATFDWNDLGTWGSLYNELDKTEAKNAVVNAKLLAQDASGNMIRTSDKKVVVVDGLDDYIIIDNEEVLLIYPKKKEQQIKEVLASVKAKFGEHYG
ncbi:mannose-1-phosphate guanylyltransferase [Aquimarina sp. W85]|uniref:mannose-1-phosphate guanylyltransferase n=1 Tax=Aquimarina rhodophyticola TaxID=3342246 RepID=UPI0036719A03